MVILRLISLLALLLGAGLPWPAAAAEGAGLSAIGQGLVSHRALYTLSVARLDPRNYRSGVTGGLSLEFINACDGFVLNQRFLIETTTDDGTILNNMVLNSWESHDGMRFRFKLRDEVNGDLDTELNGEGILSGHNRGGLVRFSQPEDTELSLPSGALFPTEHTIRMLALAQGGGHWLHAPVYDGSSADGYADVGGFIGTALPPETAGRDVLLALKGLRSWRVRLGYFPSDRAQDTPDYEIAYRLYENGVADDIVFDYGDYAIRATLSKLEVRPRDRC
ncbi:EipB family protein [Ferrovibrio sp.]|uniref:EipB family protein n=1 Tax=Ferrovibrio sp. TaxID=1917215 RepID=UPI00311D97E3